MSLESMHELRSKNLAQRTPVLSPCIGHVSEESRYAIIHNVFTYEICTRPDSIESRMNDRHVDTANV